MTLTTVPLSKLEPGKNNQRTSFDAGKIEELAQSIRQDGLSQNLVVKPARKRKHFEIVSGERRYRALCLLAERGVIECGSFQRRSGLRSLKRVCAAIIDCSFPSLCSRWQLVHEKERY